MDKKYLIAILGVVLFIVGCAGEAEKSVAGESPYIGGTKGLIAEFEQMGVYNEDSNMEEIFEDEAFPIEVTLRNKGEEAAAASDTTVTLKGINLGDFPGIVDGGSLSNDAEIEGISEYNENGGEATLDFTSGAEDAKYTIPLTGMSYDVSVFANVVYKYKTYAAVPKVCFKGDLTDPSVCEVDEMKDVYSSAAPIQVKSAEEKRAGTGKISVEFLIENVGTGDVTKPEAEFDSRYDQLSYSVSDADDWECKSGGRENEARLDKDGKATIICKSKNPLAEDDLYTKQLDLTLSYKYKEIIDKQIRIIKS